MTVYRLVSALIVVTSSMLMHIHAAAQTAPGFELNIGSGGRSAVFSVDGARILTVSKEGSVQIWSAEDGIELLAIENPDHDIQFAQTTRDGRYILGVSDTRVTVWEAGTGESVMTAEHASPIGPDFLPSISNDNSKMATLTESGPVQVWEIHSGKELRTIPAADAVFAAFNPDGTRIATTSSSDVVRVWDALTSEEVQTYTYPAAIEVALFSPNGTHLVAYSDDRVYMHEVGAAVSSPPEFEYSAPPQTTAGYLDARHVLLNGGPGELRLRAVESGETLERFDAGKDQPWLSAALRADNAMLALADLFEPWRLVHHHDGVVFLFDGAIHTVGFGPDGSRVLTADRAGSIRILEADDYRGWDAQIGRLFPEREQ